MQPNQGGSLPGVELMQHSLKLSKIVSKRDVHRSRMIPRQRLALARPQSNRTTQQKIEKGQKGQLRSGTHIDWVINMGVAQKEWLDS